MAKEEDKEKEAPKFKEPEVFRETRYQDESFPGIMTTMPAQSWYLHGMMSYFLEEGKKYCLLSDKDKQYGLVFMVEKQDPVGVVIRISLEDVRLFMGWGWVMSSEYIEVPQDTPLGHFDVWEHVRKFEKGKE